MSVKKFIKDVITSLSLDKFEEAGKKKSIKRLLKKLESRKAKLKYTAKKKLSKKEKKELQEELEIITLQITKGKKILDELNEKDVKNTKDS